MELYRVAFRVTPTPCHPKFWEIGGGYLSVFVFDDSRDAAAGQALRIVQELKVYELSEEGDLCTAIVVLAEADTTPHYEQSCAAARLVGVAFFLDCFPTGQENAALPGDGVQPSG